MKLNIELSQKNIERTVYLLIIIGLVIYGLKDSEAAVNLITAVKEAFTVLLL